jgi:hypothetical protein
MPEPTEPKKVVTPIIDSSSEKSKPKEEDTKPITKPFDSNSKQDTQPIQKTKQDTQINNNQTKKIEFSLLDLAGNFHFTYDQIYKLAIYLINVF